jgi:hypothetical protein
VRSKEELAKYSDITLAFAIVHKRLNKLGSLESLFACTCLCVELPDIGAFVQDVNIACDET